jgi:hypothetical protein
MEEAAGVDPQAPVMRHARPDEAELMPADNGGIGQPSEEKLA